RPICLRLLAHWIRAAAARTFWTAGRRRPIRIAIIAITTSSSISVKPFLLGMVLLVLVVLRVRLSFLGGFPAEARHGLGGLDDRPHGVAGLGVSRSAEARATAGTTSRHPRSRPPRP